MNAFIIISVMLKICTCFVACDKVSPTILNRLEQDAYLEAMINCLHRSLKVTYVSAFMISKYYG